MYKEIYAMDNKRISPNIHKWIRKCLKKEFENTVDDYLKKTQDCTEIAHKIIRSREMQVLINTIKMAVIEHCPDPKANFIVTTGSHPCSSASFVSDLIAEDWISPKNIENQYSYIIDKISIDKPVHVRLAGYEILLKSDLTNVMAIPQWDILQNTLKDGLVGESRPIFEASLQVHARLLSCPKAYDAYTNILSAFNVQYHTPKVHEMLPSLISGINFKFFLHEKLIRIMYLVIHYQEELLKSMRHVDKTTEEIIEQFIIFLSTPTFGNSMQIKTLSTLNIVATLDPHANWSKNWTHSLATRKTFVSLLAKSPSLVQYAIQCFSNGLKASPIYTSISICDEPVEACISGETVEIITYLHCLNFISQLCSYEMSRNLLSEIPLDTPFSVSEFLITLINILNELSFSGITIDIYNIMCQALQNILNKPTMLHDNNFYDAALYSLNNSSENDVRIWPHTLGIITHMLHTADGCEALINQESTSQELKKNCTASIIIQHISNLLKQPFSIINTEYVSSLSKVIIKLFSVFNTYEIVQDVVQNQFYPSVSYFYSKLDKYYIENENKTQHLDSIIKKLILKIVSIPFGLQDLTHESLAFEELIRGYIAPLRNSWTSNEIVSFISSAGSFNLGHEVLEDLAPHVLSTLLAETCKTLEDQYSFYDSWDNPIVKKFLHIIALFSLNFKCFAAFITNINEFENGDDKEIPSNLTELMQFSIKYDSMYHYLGLLSLSTAVWNLDIYIYLLEKLNFQNELLNLQKYCIFDTQIDDEIKTKYIIDECSLLRHKILLNSYYMKHKYSYNIPSKEHEEVKNTLEPEEYQLFSTLPPPNIIAEQRVPYDLESDSVLEDMLGNSKPGLLDSNWVLQIRSAYISSGPLKNTVLMTLLEQMWQAIPTAEWADHYEWPENFAYNVDYCLMEELYGIDLVSQYGELNGLIQKTEEVKKTFKQFLQASYTFIKYQKPNKFEGFDWFLSTVFLICEGDMDKCRKFITKFIRFPCIMFIWPILGKALDTSNNEECTTQFTFAQLLEGIIHNEMPNIAYALKNTCGTDWWLLCTTILNQCFLGILPWHEIMHFFAISVLYSPDYILYYCASLIYHCKTTFMLDVTNGKTWPEYMVLHDYRCHDYIAFMDKLAKRYGSKVLPVLTGRKLCDDET